MQTGREADVRAVKARCRGLGTWQVRERGRRRDDTGVDNEVASIRMLRSAGRVGATFASPYEVLYVFRAVGNRWETSGGESQCWAGAVGDSARLQTGKTVPCPGVVPRRVCAPVPRRWGSLAQQALNDTAQGKPPCTSMIQPSSCPRFNATLRLAGRH